ncbi:uncharacterized protein TM35_000013000 [Trypanosoma theileri]|uniref:SAM domain-containing protein n=1 Tax=Trypanosoma theileri TaxID=67003 RepID=A0A1X0P9W2_9TRYP|nr:uncharacterized protein TM35_000013000 [Trypanosoma theileri]ORC93423.1 hypothetical protein TM35_000013000 [Trypanosoma theileri]
MPFFTPRTIAVSCAAAVAVPTTIFLAARAVRRSREENGPSFSTLPTREWTTQQVAQWLRSRGVSKAAVTSFVKNDVDGKVLLLLEESHLKTLAPKLRDHLLIREGIEQLREQTSQPVQSVQATLPTPPLPQATMGGEELIKTFINTANDICTTITSPEFEQATPEERERERRMCMHKFHVMVDEVQSVDPEVMTKLLPIAHKVERLIAESERREVDVVPPQAPSVLGEQLKTLHDMIDGFLRVLNSTGMDVLTDPQVILLRERIESQINHVLEVVQRLPPQYGEPLVIKCNMVLQKIHQTPSVESSMIPPQSQPQSSALLLAPTVKRLRDIFTFLRSSQLMEMNPPERLLCIEEMVKEVKEIQRSANSWNDTRAVEVINQVSGNVVGVLEQIKILTQEEINESNGGRSEDAEESQEENTQMELPQIFASLQAVVQVLQSEEFARSSPPVQRQVVEELQMSLHRLRVQINRLPLNQATATVTAMIERAQELLQSLSSMGPNTNGEEEQQEGEEEEEQEDNNGDGDDDDVQPRASSGNPLEAEWRENMLDEVVSELEKIFEYVNSEAFEMLSSVEKANMAQRELSRLLAIEERCARLGGLGQLQDLVDPLKQILHLEIGNKAEATAAAPTPLFLSISSHLRRMNGLMESEGFKNADLDKKRTAAQSIIPQLQKITATLSELPPHERVAIQKLIEPINDKLQKIALPREENSGESSLDPQHLVAQVERVLAVVQSQEFRDASSKQRQRISSRLVKTLDYLEEECQKMGDVTLPLLPIVQRLRGQMEMFAQAVDAAEEEEEEENNNSNNNNIEESAEGEEEDNDDDDDDDDDDDVEEEKGEGKKRQETSVDTKDKETSEAFSNNESTPAEETEQRSSVASERQKLFSAVAEITAELGRSNQSNVQLSEEELQPLLGLLEMVDSVGVTTAMEKELRDEFEAQIKEAAGEVNDTSEAEASNGEVQNLMQVFEALRERLSSLNLSSISDLLPLMNIAERTLSNADQHNVPWRDSPVAVGLIAEVLSRIQALQVQFTENQRPSELENILNEAAREVREHPPQNEDQLQPYLQMLSGVQNRVNSMSVGALDAFKNLQEAILEVTRALRDDSRGSATLMDDNGDPAALLLLEISNRLREGPFPDVVLDQYSLLLDRIESADTRESIHEAVQAVREQLRLQQIGNRNNAEDEDEDDEEDDEEEEEEESDEQKQEEDEKEEHDEHDTKTNVKKDLQGSDKQAEVPSNDDNDDDEEEEKRRVEKNVTNFLFKKLPTKYVPGGAKNELLLLPRIEKKIFSEEQHFVEHTTLFDIQNISKVILHLEINGEVKSLPKLNDRVVRVKKAFAKQLEAFQESDQKSAAVLPKLRLRCRDTVISGESVRKLVICTDPEAELSDEDNNNNSQDLLKILTEGKATKTTASEEVMKEWKGRSVAVLVCESTEAEGTALSELVMLHEVLTNRYGFTVVTVGSTGATEIRNLLKEIASSGVKRLFLYYAMNKSASSSPHAVLFRDGSGLTYRDALQQVESIDRVVLAHCQPQKLTIVPAFAGSCDSFFSVELTESARDELRPVRCWLYDGLLTPAVTELLSLDEWRMLCPEDLATYVVTAMTSLSVDFGSFAEGSASSMGFFVPCDTSK